MAVGLGKIFGFRLPENFKRPYLAMSVTEFWERWNVTLRAFFMDNVYDPLRNGREGSLNCFFGLLLSVLMYSLWHGATFNFLIFGLYFVVILLVEHKFEDLINDLPYWLRHALTILCLMFGWVIFANRDIGSLANTIKAMIGEGGFSIAGDGARVAGSIPLIAVCWVGVTSIPGQVRRFWRGLCGVGVKQNHKEQKSIMEIVYLVSCFGYILLILWLCVISRVGSPVQPSIFMNL
jgi:alginate O-acetyltransferase complex protein AlgI